MCAYELVGDRAVVVPGHALSDGGLHEPGERGQHVDGREDLLGVQLAVQVDLPHRKKGGRLVRFLGDKSGGDGGKMAKAEGVRIGQRTNWPFRW